MPRACLFNAAILPSVEVRGDYISLFALFHCLVYSVFHFFCLSVSHLVYVNYMLCPLQATEWQRGREREAACV